MTQFVSESSADGNNFYLVENSAAAELLRAALDIECGSPEEVEHWGGWNYSADPWDELGGDVPEGADIDSLIEKVIEAGGVVGTVAAIKAIIVSDKDEDTVFQFSVGDEVHAIIWGD